MAKSKIQLSTTEQLCEELRGDLKKLTSSDLKEVVNDVPRKTFTAKMTGAILEFAHKQPDLAFWCGVKYYGSGSSSKVRMRRTPRAVTEAPAVVTPKVSATRRKASLAASVTE